MTLAINPRRLVQPVHEPLSLEEVKLFLRIEHSAEDALLATLIQAAREAAEHVLNISCITQTWQYQLSTASHDRMVLPCGPVTSITTVQVREREDAEWTTLAPADYTLRDDQLTLHAATLIMPEVLVTYEAGLADEAAEIPARIRYALMQHVAVLYEARGSTAVVEVGHIYAGLREVRL